MSAEQFLNALINFPGSNTLDKTTIQYVYDMIIKKSKSAVKKSDNTKEPVKRVKAPKYICWDVKKVENPQMKWSDFETYWKSLSKDEQSVWKNKPVEPVKLPVKAVEPADDDEVPTIEDIEQSLADE